MSGHLNLDALADVLAGEPSAHLDSCAPCQARLAELSAALPGVGSALAALPMPEPPADLDLEVRAAPATVLPFHRHRTRWLPALAGIAAAAVLVTGGVLYSQRGSSTTSNLAGKGGFTVSGTGIDYAPDGAALRAALPGLLAGTAAKLSPTAETLSGSTQTGPTADRAAAGAVDLLAGLRTTDGLAACLASLSDPSVPGVPLALDYARFQGQPALVVVLPAAQPDKVDIFVVGPGCSQADAKVLFFTRLPKS